MQEAVGGICSWRFHGTEKVFGILSKRGCQKTGEGNFIRDYQAMHEENFLSSWLREGTEGKAEEVEEMRKESKREEVKSEKREVEGRGKGLTLTVNGFALVSVPGSVPVQKVWRWFSFQDCLSDRDVTECVPVRVFDLTASSDSESPIFGFPVESGCVADPFLIGRARCWGAPC